jgi:hypothetical protein
MTPRFLRELANVFEAESLDQAMGERPHVYFGVKSAINRGHRPNFDEADRLEAIADELRQRAGARKRTG